MPRSYVNRTQARRGGAVGRAQVTGRNTVPSTGSSSSTPSGSTPPVQTAPVLLGAPSASPVTANGATITVALDQNCQLYIEYGTDTNYGSESVHETSFLYGLAIPHVQSLSGLTSGTTYHFRIRATNTNGQTLTSGDYTFATPSSIVEVEYDLTGVTSYGGNTIDHAGNFDSTAGLNAWIAAQPNGTDADHRAVYIFPRTSTFKTTLGLCLANKSHVTLRGFKGASNTSWLPGHEASATPGCTINFQAVVTGGIGGYPAPAHSCFIVGSGQTGPNSISFAKTCTDVIIEGFNIVGNAPTPGIFPTNGYESDNAFEIGKATGVEIRYNKADNVPGDFVRARGDSGVCGLVWVHHNYCVDAGRQGITIVEGDGQIYEENVFDRCGYYGIDIEPDDDSTLAYRIVQNVLIRNNTFGSFGSTGVGGKFCAVGNGTHTRITDITIKDNVVTGDSYGVYATSDQHRHLGTYFGQHITQTVTGTDPRIQRVTFTGNSVSHAVTTAGPVFEAGGVDTLVLTGNDSNISSGSYADVTPHSGLYTAGCTSVTNSGNT